MSSLRLRLLAASALAIFAIPGLAQSTGTLSGTVSMKETGSPMHGANVLIVELGRSILSDDDGGFTFARVPPGTYHVVAHLDHLFTEAAKTVAVESGGEASVDFLLALAAERYEITVTASELHETTFESFQDVESLDAYDLAEATAISLGEALDHRVGTGIAKRSFGPGSSRPIIRGFDGDRVLVMEDGINTGTLSSQSGDHGELVNVGQLARLEIVKGPATLLYSGNAMGGTVNAISRHHEHHPHPHQGFRGFLSGSGGTANALAGGNAGFELGVGRVMLWGHGGGVRTGDYTAPEEGQVFNSRTEMMNGGGGLGWYGNSMFLTAEARVDSGDSGVPFAHEFHAHGHEEEHDDDDEDHKEGEDEDEDEDEEEHHEEEEEELERVSLQNRRTSYRVNWGLLNLAGPVESFTLKLAVTDWQHDEIEHFHDGGSAIGTTFRNDRFTYRGVFEQTKRGPLSGRFGVWGVDRAYEVTGEEALAPPIDQNGLAFFALEELDFERFKIQFGGRIETQRYNPAYAEREGHDHDEEEEDHADDDDDEEGEEHEDDEHEAPDAVDRAFTGGSAAIGIHADTWRGGAFVANFSRSFRAPSLEELYNFGPHPGNRAFEVGDPRLDAETGNGIDISLRHEAGRVRGEFNLFYYDFSNFIFPFWNGEIVDDFIEIEFTQRSARFTGAEASLGIALHDALRLNLGIDYVDAKDTDTNTYLPRIPPLRGRIGFDLRAGGFRLSPEFVMASEQSRTFTGETSTPGYTVVNLKATYTVARQHLAHQFAAEVFNIGDQLYRNHSSFIKDLAPEIGRGVRFTYTVRFF
ncbi:MAG: TonB-dependent receptor [Bryobacterales bacterium]|nr:TonB-dependent receptor [Bryobacterales bacterium]